MGEYPPEWIGIGENLNFFNPPVCHLEFIPFTDYSNVLIKKIVFQYPVDTYMHSTIIVLPPKYPSYPISCSHP